MTAQAEAMNAGDRLMPDAERVLDPVRNVARSLWWIGLGTVVLAGESSVKLVNTAIRKGREAEPKLTGQFREAKGSVSRAAGGLGTRIGSGVRDIRHSLGGDRSQEREELRDQSTPILNQGRRADNDELRSIQDRLDALAAQIQKLQQSIGERLSQGGIVSP